MNAIETEIVIDDVRPPQNVDDGDLDQEIATGTEVTDIMIATGTGTIDINPTGTETAIAIVTDGGKGTGMTDIHPPISGIRRNVGHPRRRGLRTSIPETATVTDMVSRVIATESDVGRMNASEIVTGDHHGVARSNAPIIDYRRQNAHHPHQSIRLLLHPLPRLHRHRMQLLPLLRPQLPNPSSHLVQYPLVLALRADHRSQKLVHRRLAPRRCGRRSTHQLGLLQCTRRLRLGQLQEHRHRHRHLVMRLHLLHLSRPRGLRHPVSLVAPVLAATYMSRTLQAKTLSASMASSMVSAQKCAIHD